MSDDFDELADQLLTESAHWFMQMGYATTWLAAIRMAEDEVRMQTASLGVIPNE